jgi:hypothetical protein
MTSAEALERFGAVSSPQRAAERPWVIEGACRSAAPVFENWRRGGDSRRTKNNAKPAAPEFLSGCGALGDAVAASSP